jgi:N-acetylmuramoyl-L-alanine amidase/V8-like Glu-specific endopeptidase
MARIVIDAGHGGTARAGNSSAYGSRGPSGILEKDVTLDIARQVVARLGGDAALTRTGDANLSLGARAAHASRGGADVFVSIHANSGPPEMSGPETWVHPAAGADSHRLAGGIQRSLERLAGRYGGSAESRRGPMAVLSPAALGRRTSACLVEVDYLTNPRGEQRLGDPGERAAIGAAIAGAIREHIALERPSPDPHIIPDPAEYSGAGVQEAARVWLEWFGRYTQWRAGVPNAACSYFPHTAICELEITTNDSTSPGYGTGFFIGPEKILTCGHNFKSGSSYATSIVVRPGKRSRMSVLGHQVAIPDWRRHVHPRWVTEDNDFDLAVLRTPGLSAPGGHVFPLPTMTPAGNQNIVVCGYGKFVNHPDPMEGQGQYMDGSHITHASDEQYHFPIQSIPGHSGSPVFWPSQGNMVVAVLTGPRLFGPSGAETLSDYENRGVRLTPGKLDWINQM